MDENGALREKAAREDGTEGEALNPRYFRDGLSDEEVRSRRERGLTNAFKLKTSRSLAHIIRANVFNRFNALLGALAVVVLVLDSPRDALFGMVLVFNTLIGIVQEWRAKRVLDRLTLISAPRARVVRNGREEEVAKEDIVLDDLVELRAGDQVLVDGEVLESEGLEVDESLLTGESVPVLKAPGDEVLSGSFVVSGTGRFRATAVGEDAYAQRIAAQARRFTVVSSELRRAINTVLRYITWIMIPIALAFAISQVVTHGGIKDAAITTVAGLVGMVPEGLVLLTSIVFAVSAVTLARRNVLVQELPAVEGLARVDVVCLDKTGTLTEGTLTLHRLECLSREEEVREALGAFAAAFPGGNATIATLAEALPAPRDWEPVEVVPFSSARKWSAAFFHGRGGLALGAPEILLEAGGRNYNDVRERAEELAREGLRVLLFAGV